MKKIGLLLAMCLGIFLCMLDTTVMNITLPAIQSNLNVSMNQLSWALNIYTITFAALTIPLGRVAEIVGKNRMYVLALLVFLGASLLCGFSGSVGILIVGRFFQSIGAAMIFPMSMTIGIEAFSVKRRKKVIAALGVTQGLASALGPTIGGFVTEFLGWRWVFFINVPIVLICLCLCGVTMNFKKESKVKRKLDILGSLLCMGFLFSLTLFLMKGNDWGWQSIVVLRLIFASLLFLVVFIWWQRKVADPMIPFTLFKNRQFSASVLTGILSNLFLVAVTVILPTYFTQLEGKSELQAAFLITPITLMIFIFSPIAAYLIDWLGPRIVIFSGFFAMGLAYVSFNELNPTNFLQVAVTCGLLGFGYGIITGPIMVLAAADFKGELLTASQSIIGALRQIGVVLAVAIFVSGLTVNLTKAKQNTMDYAVKQVADLQLDAATSEKMLAEISKKINNQEAKESTSGESKSENLAIYQGIEKIKKYGRQASIRSFLSLYGKGSPFVFASCLCGLLFLSRKKYRIFVKQL